MQKNEAKINEAVLQAAKIKLLQVEEPGYLEAEGFEKTWKFTQDDILKNVPLASANKVMGFLLYIRFDVFCLWL